ncbi:hypothetical protein GCM10020367_60650 [Streptomyces sannanensis]|uniref:Uncharacterized protein n=1 Tax=Streptomyces sannanensis TaxID=285536 RepID=A0ABP6SKG9_9ACTN
MPDPPPCVRKARRSVPDPCGFTAVWSVPWPSTAHCESVRGAHPPPTGKHSRDVRTTASRPPFALRRNSSAWWTASTHLEDVPPEEMEKRAAEAMGVG